MSVKKRVRIIKNWQWPPLLQQTPEHKGTWDNIQFTEEAVKEYDYLIILNNLDGDPDIFCPLEHVWRIVQEPPTGIFKQWHINPSSSFKTFTCDPDLSGSRYVRSQPMLPWHVNRDYDFLANCHIPEKSKHLSWITTTRNILPGHKKRMNFLKDIRGKIPELDLLGGNIKHILNRDVKEKIEQEQRELGFKHLEDKWAGLAPYKYSLAIENYKGPDYWSEKIADCFLAWTVPIYYGCTNLEDYFPKNSFIRIDIENPTESLETIQKIIIEDSWEKRLPALKEARDLVLNKYQLFPCIAHNINSISPRKSLRTGDNKSAGHTKPKISVVVCTYNRDRILAGCLESLVNQQADSNSYEVIVIDNNSTDNTLATAKSIAKKHHNFNVFYEKKQGLSHARNLGMKEAKADHIAFIDDDARANETWLDQALKIIDEKDPDIFGGPAYPLFLNGKPDWFKDEYGIRGDMGDTRWLDKGFIVGTNIFFRKSLLEHYGGFDPNLGMKGDNIGYHEETRLVFRALKEKKKVFFSRELAVKDLLPGYKKSLAFFIYSKYRAGADGLDLWECNFELPELRKLLQLIKETMEQFNFALLKRNKNEYEYPENYIIDEDIINNFFRIGQRTEFFLKNDNLTDKAAKSLLTDADAVDKIAEKIADGKLSYKFIKGIIRHKFKNNKIFKSMIKSSGRDKKK